MDGFYQGFACINGHKIGMATFNNTAAAGAHCPKCGEAVHGSCADDECGAELLAGAISATIDGRRNASCEDVTWELASYCYNCGKPYPWTETRAAALASLIDELDELDAEEREQLKAGIPDLLAETPSSDVAVLRWKKAIMKLTGAAEALAIKVLEGVVTASVKAMLFG